jgi:hypothetical protein
VLLGMKWRGVRKDEDIKKDKTSSEKSGVRTLSYGFRAIIT